jgi:hypothetical protein
MRLCLWHSGSGVDPPGRLRFGRDAYHMLTVSRLRSDASQAAHGWPYLQWTRTD